MLPEYSKVGNLCRKTKYVEKRCLLKLNLFYSGFQCVIKSFLFYTDTVDILFS